MSSQPPETTYTATVEKISHWDFIIGMRWRWDVKAKTEATAAFYESGNRKSGYAYTRRRAERKIARWVRKHKKEKLIEQQKFVYHVL